MESIDLFRKIGYKQRYNDNHCVIYDLKEKDSVLPTTIIIQKSNYDIQLLTDYVEEYTRLGTFTFGLPIELLDAINLKIQELKESNKR